ncbi:hypothetical protein CQW23_34087 [Capsicum baccatum]|uniref:Uncharacterized protein n=1 Tax=Capsicum baccatum TaxID=33114 RepID=A0A2G2V049_CAPBA|nr:hypothetical protein CQW23_34087 [Capsicum baccatum]
MSLSVVVPVVASVQTGLTLGFRVPSVNVVTGGAGIGDMKWKDDFGSMKNGIRSSSFLSFITGKGSGSIVNVAPPSSSSTLLLPMALAIFAEKQFKKVVMFSKINEELALQEATSIGLKIMEHLIKLVAFEPVVQVNCREIIDFVVAKLKKANSMEGWTGHARFRHGPVQAQNKAESQAQNEAESQARAKVQVHDSLSSLSLSLWLYGERDSAFTSAAISSGVCGDVSVDRINAWV